VTHARRFSLTLLLVMGLAWSLLLGLGGAWLLGAAPAMWSWPGGDTLRAAGLCSIVAGQLVFLAFVADRVFPRVSRRLVLCTEVPLCVVLFAGLGVLVWTLA
jgi:hypothetical protein